MVQQPGVRETLERQQYYHYFSLARWFGTEVHRAPRHRQRVTYHY